MVMRLFKLVLVSAVLGSLFSCSISPDPMRTLDSSTSSYERAVRWGEFTRAKSFHKNEPTLSDLERRRLKLYRVTGYSVNNTGKEIKKVGSGTLTRHSLSLGNEERSKDEI